jgi:hypothetical protein
VEGVHTSWPYLSATFFYYLTNEQIVCQDLAEHMPGIRYFRASECREKLFGNLILKIVALVLASAVNVGCLFCFGRWKLVIVASYLNVYLKLKDIFKSELVRKSGTTDKKKLNSALK